MTLGHLFLASHNCDFFYVIVTDHGMFFLLCGRIFANNRWKMNLSSPLHTYLFRAYNETIIIIMQM